MIISLVVITLITLAAYEFLFGTTTRKWQEQVQLTGGRIIMIQRKVTAADCCGENFGTGGVISQKIIFKDDSQKIVWEDDLPPIIFDIVNSKYYVVAQPRSNAACSKHGDPNPAFIFYRYESGEWAQIKNTEFPDGLQTNLIIDYWMSPYDWDKYKKEPVLVKDKPYINGNLDNITNHFIGHFNKDLNQKCSF